MQTKSRFKNRPLLSPMNMIKLTCVVCALILITGCGFHFTHTTDSLPSGGKAIFVDARQRGIIANVVKSKDSMKKDSMKKDSMEKDSMEKDSMNSVLRICSEPPPDVFSAITASLDLNASPTQGGAVSVGLSAFLNENAATIERTQTINILRESMYRTCERYMSGAISENEFIVQAARDQRVMAAVLAIEQLTGVQKAASTALTAASSAMSSAVSGGLSPEAMTALKEAWKDYTSLQAKANAKKEEADDSKPVEACSGLDESTTDEDKKNKPTLCKEAEDLQQQADQAKAHYDFLKKTMEQVTVTLATHSEGRLGGTGGINQDAAPDCCIADKVVEIVKNIDDFDEVQMTCVVLFRNISKLASQKITPEEQKFLDNCLELMIAKTEAETEEEKAKMAKAKTQIEEEKVLQAARIYERVATKKRTESLLKAYDRKINKLWKKIDSGNKGAVERFNNLIEKADVHVLESSMRLIRLAIENKEKDDFSTQIGRADIHSIDLDKLLEQE